jgi:ribosomal protein L16/L10AE
MKREGSLDKIFPDKPITKSLWRFVWGKGAAEYWAAVAPGRIIFEFPVCHWPPSRRPRLRLKFPVKKTKFIVARASRIDSDHETIRSKRIFSRRIEG